MIELLRKRRSIRSYTAETIAPATVELLIEALLRAPSSRNINPWEFIVVDDRELLSKLSRAKEHGSAFLEGAQLGIVVCADSTTSDVWVEDCSIASILVQMTALSLGLGSCWIQIRQRRHDAKCSAEEYIQKLLGLPEHVKVQSMISIGHPDEVRMPLRSDELEYFKVKHNHFDQPWYPGDKS
ncbi:MAG: nitroreductase family protein [Desulfuromonadales bacterium]|nr:nitroreductase family protein [Desulfuromonadales bacterium]